MLRRSTVAIVLFSRLRKMTTVIGRRRHSLASCCSRRWSKRMEADWAAEIGADLPSIDVPWECFVDLRDAPSAAAAVEEAIDHPALREALLTLNSKASPVFTTKCDVWTLSSSEIDHDEFASHFENAQEGFASYIDILQRDPDQFASFDFHERWSRSLTHHLQDLTLSNGRAEIVIRPANVDASPGYGLTLYAA